ncbi:unnamed protein product [Anisakis simplex]|uniref:Uncharacterized protein n=1 Tax=Anisakis simplex TaxID=6269 RepID=A0A3P6SQ31_ANISI|nr:unnamed protein product [Anisakis simplex]
MRMISAWIRMNHKTDMVTNLWRFSWEMMKSVRWNYVVNVPMSCGACWTWTAPRVTRKL